MSIRIKRVQQWILYLPHHRIALAAMLLSLGAWFVFWFDLA
ncbi:hypothetical protein SAMN05216567_1367 [Variovorax sp. OK605]|jgi:hypothetical protein|nr:hypothetical protein [Variovorax sp. OK605]SFQ74421.1 hypothetical protein SAMN05216567_1367 [Variovorax sp. OK605]